MKTLHPRVAALLWLAVGCPLFAADNDTPPAAAAAPAEAEHGYTVTFEIHVNDKGEEETLKMVGSEDPTPDRFIDKLALAMAIKTDLPARQKDGKNVAYTARLPFFFPIEGDEGPAANDVPKPVVSRESGIPLYPPELRDAGIVGGAIFEMQIDATGKLTKLRTLRASHSEFETAARQVLEKWVFKPAQKDGQPVASRCNIAIVFEMGEKVVDLKWRIPPPPEPRHHQGDRRSSAASGCRGPGGHRHRSGGTGRARADGAEEGIAALCPGRLPQPVVGDGPYTHRKIRWR